MAKTTSEKFEITSETTLEDIAKYLIENKSGQFYEAEEFINSTLNSIAKYPNKPFEPKLLNSHTSNEAHIYAEALKKYEKQMVEYNKQALLCKEIRIKLYSAFEMYIEEESGLNSIVPKQYRKKVSSKAYSYGHSSGYYDIYVQLKELVDIFK